MNTPSRSLQNRKRSLLALPPRERVETILSSPRPAEVVRSLAAQEFFLTLTEAGLECSAPLLRLASRHQIDFLLDVEAWSREGFDPVRFSRWIEAFRKSDAEVVVRWMKEADESSVVLALSRMIQVYKLDESTDESFWPPERKLPSLDGVYFLDGQEEVPDDALKAVWDGLGLLRERQPEIYESLLEQVLWIVPAEQEEQAYEQRESRLAERGFPSFDEALEVWAAGPEDSPQGREILAKKVRVPDDPTPPDPGARALIPVEGEGLDDLNRALAALTPVEQERVVHNIVRLGNRFAVASLDHLGEASTHHQGLTAAFSHLNLALALLSEGKPEGFAAAALRGLSVFDLCRAGVGGVLERVGRAERIAGQRQAGIPAELQRLDLPIRLSLEGLLSPRPLLKLEDESRPFQTLADLQHVDDHLGAAEAFKAWGLPKVSPLPAGYENEQQIEWSPVVLTALARHLAGKPAQPQPLRRDEGRLAIDNLTAPDALAQACRAEGLAAALPYLTSRVEDSLAPFETDAPIEPRQLRALLFEARTV